MPTYSIQDWYWTSASNNTEAFSSASFSWVPLTDATYVAWQADGGVATVGDPLPKLAALFAAQWLPQSLAQGAAFNSTSNPDLDGTYALDMTSITYITALSSGIMAGKPLPGGGTRFTYAQHAFSGPEFVAFAIAAENYIYNLSQAVGSVIVADTGSLPTVPVVID